mgnify:CR=1 FL=1
MKTIFWYLYSRCPIRHMHVKANCIFSFPTSWNLQQEFFHKSMNYFYLGIHYCRDCTCVGDEDILNSNNSCVHVAHPFHSSQGKKYFLIFLCRAYATWFVENLHKIFIIDIMFRDSNVFPLVGIPGYMIIIFLKWIACGFC